MDYQLTEFVNFLLVYEVCISLSSRNIYWFPLFHWNTESIVKYCLILKDNWLTCRKGLRVVSTHDSHDQDLPCTTDRFHMTEYQISHYQLALCYNFLNPTFAWPEINKFFAWPTWPEIPTNSKHSTWPEISIHKISRAILRFLRLDNFTTI